VGAVISRGMTANAAAASPDFDLRDLIDGAGLLASTANAVMQLALPAVGYGVLESKVESGQVMRHPFRRIHNTVTYVSVALMRTAEERVYYRRQVNRSHALDPLMMLDYLPWPFGTALGPVNRFLTTGFLPRPFREQMQLHWTERDQCQFDFLLRMVASVNRLLPAPVARFPFGASLQELRLRMMRNRLRQLRLTVTPRSVREIKDLFMPNGP
jgi:uncharacterized protein (DUF2236 family)